MLAIVRNVKYNVQAIYTLSGRRQHYRELQYNRKCVDYIGAGTTEL